LIATIRTGKDKEFPYWEQGKFYLKSPIFYHSELRLSRFAGIRNLFEIVIARSPDWIRDKFHDEAISR
jgi:hypothetical protein